MMLRIYLVTWRVLARKGWLTPGLPGYMRVWARKGWLPPGFPGYMKSMGKERMTAPGLPGYMKSMGKERIVVPWFTWVHEEYDKGKDVCPLLYLVVTWRVWARKGCLSPGLPGYMMSMSKERMSAPWFTLVTWRVKSRKECLPPGLPGYMMSMGKERMSAPRNVSLGKVCRSYEGNLAEPWHLASVLGTVNRTR